MSKKEFEDKLTLIEMVEIAVNAIKTGLQKVVDDRFGYKITYYKVGKIIRIDIEESEEKL